jgi:hypothetical protein
VIQHRKSALIGNAVRPAIEMLENRQMLSATLSVSSSLMVFNAVENSAASQTETLKLTNIGNAPLTLGSSAITISSESGGSRFGEVNASSIPSTLAAGASFGLQLNYNAVAVETDSSTLDITTNDPVNPVQQILLHGIGTRGLGGSNQPSLATILQAYDIPTLVGEGPNDDMAAEDSIYPTPPDASSQEVALQRLVKAGTGPVTIDVLASFTASGTHPYTLGIYTPGDPKSLNQLFTTPSSEYQSTYVQPQGATSFDPGTGSFGFYFVSNVQVTGRIGYSEDALNTWDTTVPRKFRFFPMETSSGAVVPNTYIMTSTEWNAPIGYDFTNIVAIVSNVKAAPGAPGGPVMGLQNLDAVPGSNTMVFDRIQNPNTSVGDVVHDTGTLQVNNTGDEPLIITSYTLSSAWTLVNPPTFPVTVAAGADLDLSIKFVATSEPTVPYNETNSPQYPTGGGIYSGTLTLNSNDPETPTSTVPLEGWWQHASENENEPSLQTITNLLFNWGTFINSTPIPDLNETTATSGGSPTYYGEETVSAYWEEADPSLSVSVEQIAAYHTEGNTGSTYWYTQGSPSTLNKLYTTVSDDGQTLFPNVGNTSTPAIASFSSTGIFGFKDDTEFSDDSLNPNSEADGHHVRFYPVRDAEDNLIPNEYIMTMDYSASPENFDFQDNVWLVSNIRPATIVTGIASPQTTGAPAAPTDLFVTSTGGVNTLEWAPIIDSTVKGYYIYRSTTATGTYTLLNSTVTPAITYTDTTAPTTGTSYYKVEALDSNNTQSLGDRASVANTSATTLGDPVAANETVTTAYETNVIINEFPDATDNANGTLEASTVTVTTGPSHGTTLVNPTNGAITYTPATGFSGTDTFQYTISDNTGETSTPALVTITVTGQTAGDPVAANLSYTAIQGVPLTIDDVSEATDTTATIDPTSVVITSGPSHGFASVNPTTGVIIYTATAGYAGTDSIQYTIADSLNAVSPVATISLKVVASGPVASNVAATASANGTSSINVISSGADAGANIVSAAITTQPAHGTAVVDPGTGNIVYSPAAGYFGSDSLQYTLTDSTGVTSAPATLTLNVGVAINNTTAKTLSFTDSSGNLVKLTLTGGGFGDVFFSGTGSVQSIAKSHSVVVSGVGLSISNIAVSGSADNGVLTISRKGTASVALGSISVDGAIGKIIAPTSTLTGTLAVSGALTQLQLASASGATISVGSLQATPAGFSFTSGHVVNTTLTSTMPVKSIKVIDWTVTGTTDSVTAPSIASLVTAGNFQAALTTTGATPFSLKTVKIGGEVDAQGWNISGASSSLTLGSVAPGWIGTFSAPINSLTVRGGGFAGTLNASGINTLSIIGNDTGTISAGSIRTARVAGQLIGASIDLTNPVATKVTSLGKLIVTGATLNSQIDSVGNIGSIVTAGISASSIDAGTAAGVTLPTSATSFTASASIASISIIGSGSRFTNTNIGAEIIGSLRLGVITTTNNATSFGIGAVTVNSLTANLDNGGVLRMNAADLASAGSISAYLTDHALTLGDFEIVPGL